MHYASPGSRHRLDHTFPSAQRGWGEAQTHAPLPGSHSKCVPRRVSALLSDSFKQPLSHVTEVGGGISG